MSGHGVPLCLQLCYIARSSPRTSSCAVQQSFLLVLENAMFVIVYLLTVRLTTCKICWCLKRPQYDRIRVEIYSYSSPTFEPIFSWVYQNLNPLLGLLCCAQDFGESMRDFFGKATVPVTISRWSERGLRPAHRRLET